MGSKNILLCVPVLEADQENVIKEAPQMFQKMVDLYGIERGIDAMVQLMSGGWHSSTNIDWYTCILLILTDEQFIDRDWYI